MRLSNSKFDETVKTVLGVCGGKAGHYFFCITLSSLNRSIHDNGDIHYDLVDVALDHYEAVIASYFVPQMDAFMVSDQAYMLKPRTKMPSFTFA